MKLSGSGNHYTMTSDHLNDLEDNQMKLINEESNEETEEVLVDQLKLVEVLYMLQKTKAFAIISIDRHKANRKLRFFVPGVIITPYKKTSM